MLDAWMSTARANAGSSTSGGTSTRATSLGSGTPAAEITPMVSGAAPGAAPAHSSSILASYIGQALAQGYATGATTGRVENWPQVDQGCRLGNYGRTSALCRAAELAVHGWGDTRAVPLDEVAEFCSAKYLDDTFALCLATTRGAGRPADSGSVERIAGADAGGIPEADVVDGLQWRFTLAAYGPDGKWEAWNQISSLCTRGVYASQSPVCEAAAIKQHGGHEGARVPYLEVASFCDVTLMKGGTEVCRAAYRFAQSNPDSAR